MDGDNNDGEAAAAAAISRWYSAFLWRFRLRAACLPALLIVSLVYRGIPRSHEPNPAARDP